MADFSIEPLSEDALLLRFGTGIGIGTNARVQATARALRNAKLPGITDIASAYASLLLRFDPFMWGDPGTGAPPHQQVEEVVRATLTFTSAREVDPGLRRDDESKDAAAKCARARPVGIPVCYDVKFGPDLTAVAARVRMTPDELIARHTAANYTVAMLGFAPGFPYLLGLDPALHMPRRANPRTRVPAGSVAIGGAQTGIYPRELPGGWHLIGRTPLTLFDPTRDPPCLLAPGDRVRFRAIDANAFARLAERRA